MRINKFIVSVFVFLFCSSAFAQFPQAAQLVLNGDYDGAKNYYTKILTKDSLNFEANQEMGLLLVQYYDDKGEALFYLNRAIRCYVKKDALAELYLGFAQALHYDSQYGNALMYYEKISPMPLTKNPKGDYLKAQAKLCIENCKYGIQNPANRYSSKYHVKNLGSSMNTPYPEYLPVVDPDNSILLYATRRNIILGGKKDDTEEKSYGDMFAAANTTGKFESGMPFIKQNFSVKFLESSIIGDVLVAISSNGTKILLCRTNQLYLAELKDGVWTSPILLPPTINSAPKFEGQACISNDGKIIIFNANKLGGYGGMDLYRSVLMPGGEWSEGETLGEDINSNEDEGSPFLNAEENMLYYSSKGLNGYGGYDVYKVKISRAGTFKPVNMGLPFNSPADDIGFVMNKNETEGYMSSSRKGTYGDLDLQHVLLFDRPSASNCISVNNTKEGDDVHINFSFRDSIFINDEVTFSAAGSAIKGGTIINYFWKINNEIVAKDTSVFKRKMNAEGKYNVELEVAVYNDADDVRRDYCLTKEIHIFHPKAVDVFYEPLVRKDENKLSIAGTVDVTTLRMDSSKKDILNIKLEPAFFNTNKFDLRKDAVAAVKANIAKMKVDATIIIKLTAQTDPRATKEYNLKLSQKRASSVVAYLVKSGIKKSRIIAVLALGETDVNTKGCGNDAACLEKIYQQNRRVDFKIIGAEYEAPKMAKVTKPATKKPAGTKKKK